MKASGWLLADGGKRVLAGKRYILGLYIANLALGWFATFGLSSRIGAVTDRSLHPLLLVRGFDLGVFLELINKPEVAPYSQVPLALVFAGIFMLLQLFLAGGIVTQYLAFERIDRSRFYAACGETFWKMIRVAIIFAAIAGLIAALTHVMRSALDIATESSANPRIGFALQCAVLLLEALALLWVRMWFDLAQTHLVATGIRAVRPTLAQAFTSAAGAMGLYSSYLLLGVLMSFAAALGTFIWWTTAPPSQVIFSFLLLQSALVCLLAVRWWQRALAVVWYQRNIALPPTMASASIELLPPASSVPEMPLSP